MKSCPFCGFDPLPENARLCPLCEADPAGAEQEPTIALPPG